MQILLSDIGKRFNRDWIFRKLSCEFNSGDSYAITGPNGSGKSTLLQIIAGAVASSEGSVRVRVNKLAVDEHSVFNYISIAAPYLEVIEEMTLDEFLQFHRTFKPFLPGVTAEDIPDIIGLRSSASKQLRYYSSGMKQRVKLAQAVFSDTCCVLFDEPTTNLDEAGINLYHSLINSYCAGRLIIVSSNDRQEYSFCHRTINMQDFK